MMASRRFRQFSRQLKPSLARTYPPTVWMPLLPWSAEPCRRQVHRQVGVQLYSSRLPSPPEPHPRPPEPHPSPSPPEPQPSPLEPLPSPTPPPIGLQVPLQEWYESIPAQYKKLPLLSSLQIYQKSLPVREHYGVPLPLYEHPIWALESQMDTLVDQLETRSPDGARASVKYMAAPPQSGKTAIILPAFLKSFAKADGFKFYLYLAFGNNANRRWKCTSQLQENEDDSESQGGQFILECLKVLVDKPSHSSWPCRVNLQNTPELDDVLKDLCAFFKSRFGTARVLVHLDEHRHMCPEDHPMGASFRRGALEQLALVPGVTVVATFTDLPPLPASHSWRVCREPVIVPLLNIDKAQALQELYGRIPINAPREILRLLATLKFKLAIKLKQLGLSGVHRPGIDSHVDNFFDEFHGIQQKLPDSQQKLPDCQQKLSDSQQAAMLEALKACINLSNFSIAGKFTDVNAAKLLLGVPDFKESKFHRQVYNLVVNNSLFTCSIPHLMRMEDPSCKVYDVGAVIFRDSLLGPDYLAHTPLEAGYIWALSVAAAVNKGLLFDQLKVSFDCAHLKPGRIFADNNIKSPNFEQLAKGTMYHADQRKGKKTHPLADIFFRDDDGNIVLIDITGGKQVNQKMSRLASFIGQCKVATPEQTVYGIVIAPNVEESPSTSEDTVYVVCGVKARLLLCGLSQVYAWFSI